MNLNWLHPKVLFLTTTLEHWESFTIFIVWRPPEDCLVSWLFTLYTKHPLNEILASMQVKFIHKTCLLAWGSAYNRISSNLCNDLNFASFFLSLYLAKYSKRKILSILFAVRTFLNHKNDWRKWKKSYTFPHFRQFCDKQKKKTRIYGTTCIYIYSPTYFTSFTSHFSYLVLYNTNFFSSIFNLLTGRLFMKTKIISSV